jgi:hypothetical protein
MNATITPARAIVTLNVETLAMSSANLSPLSGNNPTLIRPFEMVWMRSLQTLMVFHTGLFDQLIYTSPSNGQQTFAINDLANFGDAGAYIFMQNDFLEDDDTWQNSCIDQVNGLIFFQCTDISSSSGSFGTTTMCQVNKQSAQIFLFFFEQIKIL